METQKDISEKKVKKVEERTSQSTGVLNKFQKEMREKLLKLEDKLI